jgi:spermidine synthase
MFSVKRTSNPPAGEALSNPIPIFLVVLGLLSILGQVVLLRELHVAFYGVDLAYLIALGIWLFWTAFGALLGGRYRQPSYQGIILILVFFGALIVPETIFIRAGRLLMAAVPGAFLPLSLQFTLALLSLMPAGLLLGCMFPWSASLYAAHGGSLAMAYALESVGGFVGGLIATASVAWGLQNMSLAVSCGLIAIVVACGGLLSETTSLLRRVLMLMLLGAMGILLWQAPLLDRLSTAWNHTGVLESRDSPYGRVTVTSISGQVTVFENDSLSFDTEGTGPEVFSHLAALQHHMPETVLILGGGIEGTIREILKYEPRKVDYVEINPVVISTVLPYLPSNIQQSLQDHRVRLIVGDPRYFVLHSNNRYDLILVGMPEPASGQANRFYTREFFGWCSERLKPNGILAFRIRSAENYWTPQLALRAGSIYRALKSVFREVIVLPGAVDIYTASHAPLPDSPDPLIRRFEAKGIRARLVSPAYIRYLYTNDRFAEARNRLAVMAAPVNTDMRPVCYRFSLFVWLSKFFPRLAWEDISIHYTNTADNPIPWLLAALAGLFLLTRVQPAVRRSAFVAAAAFAGMVLETVLILHYQVKQGTLFQDIGMLLTSFMAGLSVGAVIMNSLARDSRLSKLHLWGAIQTAALILLSSLVYWITESGGGAGLMASAALIAAAGFIVAGVFTTASLEAKLDNGRGASVLYASDLAGGCIGCIMGSLFWIPLAGLDAAVLGMITLSFLLFLLV